MYHSITLDGLNTWDDWHLIPTSKPVIPIEGFSANQVDIPNRNGFVDITENLTGSVTFGSSQSSVSFIVTDEYYDSASDRTIQNRKPQYIYEEFRNLFHGRAVSMILEDYPGTEYQVRLTVGSFSHGFGFATFTMGYTIVGKVALEG